MKDGVFAVHSCTNTHIAAIRAAARRKIVRRACSRARAFLHALACSNSRAPSETNCSSSLIPAGPMSWSATEDGSDWHSCSKTNFSWCLVFAPAGLRRMGEVKEEQELAGEHTQRRVAC